MRPRVILHIGRNKAGSTTIQDFCIAQRDALEARGITYALLGHLGDSRADMPGFITFESLREYVSAHPDKALLVSNEFMFGWPDVFTEGAARVLADCDVRIIAYIRSYDRWIVSAYAEETRKGMNLRDIDEYLQWMAPRVSAWPYLRAWGECFGWDALRVRALDPRSLEGGELIADFCHALALEGVRSVPVARNASPNWLELELARRLTACNSETEWAGVSHVEFEPLLAALRPLLPEAGQKPYLSLEAGRRLVGLYNDDLARIEAAGGGVLPRAADPSDPHRSAAPRFADAPTSVLAAFFGRTCTASFAAAHPQAAARAERLAREMGDAAPFRSSHI